MLFKKNNFFFLFFLVIGTLQVHACMGSMFARLINTVTCGSLAKSLVLRYQMFLNARALKQLEKSHKRQLTQILGNTKYPTLDNQAHKIFRKNSFIQKELNAVSFKNQLLSKVCGPKFTSQAKEELELYKQLWAQKEDIFKKAYKEVYKKEYYNSRRSLSGTITELNNQIPIRFLQKIMD